MERIARPDLDQSISIFSGGASRTGQVVISTKGLKVGYNDGDGPTELLNVPDLKLARGFPTAVIGDNGTGKSTFIKTVIGMVPPLERPVALGQGVKVGYYNQGVDSLVDEHTVLEIKNMPFEQTRFYLARFLFQDDDVFREVGACSGGEKSRLALARLLITEPNLLVMDEPTIHFDIPNREALEQVLLSYQGTILLVSHDRHLVSLLTDSLLVMADGRADAFPGTFEEWSDVQKEMETATATRVRERPAPRFAASASQVPEPETPASFVHEFDPRLWTEASPKERLELYETLWAEPGFKKFLSNFRDVMAPREANEDYAEFVRGKIRERVHDPEVAEMLVPKDHTFGAKRIPCETGYYEAYNRDNVLLVDVRKAPIERITPNGVKTANAEYDFDVIIYATGYDAVTGAILNIDFRGEGGETLKGKFVDGPRTYIGVSTVGFPNLFTLNSASVGNFVRGAEPLVDWVADCISYVRDNGFTRISPTIEAEEAWVKHVNEDGENTLRTKAANWFVGANIPGKPRALLLAPDSAPAIKAKRLEIAANGYEGFLLQ